MKKVFFAGFDSSVADSPTAIRSQYSVLCAKFGCKAVFPADAKHLKNRVKKPFDTPLDEAKSVFATNLQKIDSSDVIIANLDYFNGFCTNDTAFMIGYSKSRHKRILGFVDYERPTNQRCNTHDYMRYMPDQKSVFDQSSNSTMAACAVSIIVRGSIEDCLSIIYSDPQEENYCEEPDYGDLNDL